MNKINHEYNEPDLQNMGSDPNIPIKMEEMVLAEAIKTEWPEEDINSGDDKIFKHLTLSQDKLIKTDIEDHNIKNEKRDFYFLKDENDVEMSAVDESVVSDYNVISNINDFQDKPDFYPVKTEIYDAETLFKKESDVTCDLKLKEIGQKLKLKLLKVAEAKMLACSQCSFTTESRRILLYHMKAHQNSADSGRFICKVCGFKAKYRSVLQRHMFTHTDDTAIFTCSYCKFRSNDKTSVTCHVMNVHKGKTDIKIYACSNRCNNVNSYRCECGYQTETEAGIRTHLIVHKNVTEAKMLTCNTCGFQTKFKKSLQMHMVFHQNKIQMVDKL